MRQPPSPVRRSGGYSSKDGGGAVQRLREHFLHYVATDFPHVVVGLGALRQRAIAADDAHGAPDPWLPPARAPITLAALEAIEAGRHPYLRRTWTAEQVAAMRGFYRDLACWADQHHLAAPWVLGGAITALISDRDSDFGLFLVPEQVLRPTSRRALLKLPLEYDHLNPVEWRDQRIAAAIRQIDRYIESVVAELEADPKAERAPFVQQTTLRNLRVAARWQVAGDQRRDDATSGEDEADPKAIRDLLKRIGLRPRPGL